MQNLRAFQWEDLDSVIALLEACEPVDRNGSIPTPESLRHSMSIPGYDVKDFVLVLPSADGGLIAFCAGVPIPGSETVSYHIDVTIHPGHRQGTLAEDLLRHLESGARAWCAREGRAANLHVSVRAHQAYRMQLFERSGYQPVRWFLQLERDLTVPIPEMPTPEGFILRPPVPAEDAHALYIALTDSFQDHWNPVNLTQEQVMHLIQGPHFRPELNLLAFAADGEPAGLCLSGIREDYNRQNNTREGMVETLGVRRPYRHLGLARALLTRALHLLRDAGMTMAVLDVDSENPTGATRLYTGVGFTERRRTVVLQKAVVL
jgi:mycothiol synthase